MKTIKISFFLVIAMMLTLAACTKKSSGDPAAVLPQSAQVSDWAKTGDTRSFEADKLYEYIDGDAEKYVQAGVQRTATSDYKYKDTIEAVVDVHAMKTPEGAQQIMDGEPAANSTSANLGDESRLYGQSLVFRKGNYLVRVVSYQQSPEVANAIVQLGRGVEQNVK